MGEPSLQRVRMLSRQLLSAACSHADHKRNVTLTSRHMQQSRGIVHNLIQCQQAEIYGHDLHNRSHAIHGGTDPGTGKGRFAKRCIDDAISSKLFLKPHAYGKTATISTDILSH